jgi:hypothetical protein
VNLTYQAQAQEQQQDPGESPASGNPADGPVPDGHGDDSLINDILGGAAPAADEGEDEPPTRKKPVQEEDEPEDPIPDDDEDALEVPDDPDVEDEEFEEAAEQDGKVTGKLADARKALKAGNIDEAFMLAFGKKPEEVQPNNHVWTQWRAANDRAAKKQVQERQAFEGEKAQVVQEIRAERLKIHNTIEQLKPYEKYRIAEQAFERDGDPQHLVTIVEGITKQPYNEAQKIILTKTRRSPTERALQERLQQLEAKLQETAAEREQQSQQQTQAQAYAADLDYIQGQVTGVITKVPKYRERIYAILVKTKSAVGLTMTPQQAADQVLKSERKRLASHPLIKKPAGKPGVPAKDARTGQFQRRKPGSGPPLRRDSQNNGARNKDTETQDDIIADILGKGRKAS